MKKDIKTEEMIIKAFFYKNKQERLLYEFSRGDNDQIIHRLSDNPENYLNQSCITEKSTKGRTTQEILNSMKMHGVKQICYVISEYEDLNRKECDLITAIEKLNMNNFAFLIVGLPSGYTFFQGESYASYKPNCFLKPERRFDGKDW